MDLKDVQSLGQSIWLDFIRRQTLKNGELARLVQRGVRGVTSNPAIFEKAIAGNTDYDDAIAPLAARGLSAGEIYESLAIEDIRAAAAILRPVYDESKRDDGYVSLEVSPYLAHDTAGTVAEARRLWKEVDRENVMIKVPATAEGIPAIETLLGEGINVNVTLLFATDRYREVAETYVRGLEAFAGRGGDLSRVASVASFFVSRVDTLANKKLDALAQAGGNKADIDSVLGKVGIANSKLAYQDFKTIFGSERFRKLAARAARPQRVLWASTSTKDSRFRDVMYVEELIGRDTVDTVPPATLDAFMDHGAARASLEEDVDGARRVMATLEKLGVSLKEVTDQVLAEGVTLFADRFDKLLGAVAHKRASILGANLNRMQSKLPDGLAKDVHATMEDWRKRGNIRRLWAHDASLWTNHDEAKWLAWLTAASISDAEQSALDTLAQEVKAKGYTHVALLGMGGSSLFPDVLSATFGQRPGFPRLEVLDSTDPAQVLDFEASIALTTTLFIVSSKSGSTLEPNLFAAYFHGRVADKLGADEASKRFIAITDPGSALEKHAQEQHWGRIFPGIPAIGGRYSALSNFGRVPAAAMGLDVRDFFARTRLMAGSCAAAVPPDENPGVQLGVILGTAARQGRDKVTIIASPGIVLLGAWLEQLLAESTGKEGKGLIPVDRESLAPPSAYGNDRVFAYLRLDRGADPAQDAAVEAIELAGHPVVRMSLGETADIGQEIYRWEIATAVAGAVLRINPFDQPDVEASKVEARKLTDEFERTGQLKSEPAFFTDGQISLYADERNQAELEKVVGGKRSLAAFVQAHIQRLGPGDYFGLLAWLNRTEANRVKLEAMRDMVRDARHSATCLGFGPRFLHSTGQAYKGGPNSGVFLQITAGDPRDAAVPGRKATFGVVKRAQARGDFRVLAQRGRRLLRIDLGDDVNAGLDVLARALKG